MKRSEAMKLIEARHSSYANYPGGVIDETDLLILSSIEREKPKCPPKRKTKRKGKAGPNA